MLVLDIYDVDIKYIRDLHSADSKVMSVSPQIGKDTRRFVGVVVMLNGQNYCIPLSSGDKEKYQNKKSNIDMIKIYDESRKNENGAPKIIAVLNINNMIPVNGSVIKKVNLKVNSHDTAPERKRKELLQKEIRWCRNNSELIVRRAIKVYGLVVENPEKNRLLTRRCCDFKRLEAVLQKRVEKEKVFC